MVKSKRRRWSYRDRVELHESQGGRCAYCGRGMMPVGTASGAWSEATIDHVVPLSRGGLDSAENVVMACLRCNVAKGSREKTPEGWGPTPSIPRDLPNPYPC